jgi:excisionase family DNA binding protein
VTLGKAAAQLGVSPVTVRRLIDRRQLTTRHVPGAHRKVLASEISALAASVTVPALAAAS